MVTQIRKARKRTILAAVRHGHAGFNDAAYLCYGTVAILYAPDFSNARWVLFLHSDGGSQNTNITFIPIALTLDRLISILIDRGIQTMERVIEMETAAKYHLWHWYSGALHQNHYALLMSTIILCRPRHKESVRMWRGLEYVFEPPPLPPIARARWIVTHSCLRMDHYLTKRRLRTPAEFHDHLNEVLWLSEQHSPSSTELRSRASIRRPPLHRDPPSSTSQRQSTSSDFRRPSLEPRSSSDASFQAYQETASRKPPAQNKQILHVDWVSPSRLCEILACSLGCI